MKTAVHCPTQEDYDRLMVAYEKKGWKWLGGGNAPTSVNYWIKYKAETCVDFEDELGYAHRDYYKAISFEIITVDEAIGRLFPDGKNFKSAKEIGDYYSELGELLKKSLTATPEKYLLTLTTGKPAKLEPINSLSNPTTMDKIKSAIRGVSKKVQLRRKHEIETVEGDLTSYGQEVILNLLWKGVKPEQLKDEIDKILKNLED